MNHAPWPAGTKVICIDDTFHPAVFEYYDRIPVKGEVIRFSNYIFTIDAADKRRIKSVKVKINPIENAE